MSTVKHRLNRSQVLILRTLATATAPLSRAEIQRLSGASVPASNLGSATGGDDEPGSLAALGLVKAVVNHPDAEAGGACWAATPKGKKVGLKTTVIPKSLPLPRDILDPVVRRFLPTLSASPEYWTDEDYAGLRLGLPEDYQSTPLPDLRRQVLTRRKVGAYRDKPATASKTPAERRTAAALRCVKEFGPGGTVLEDLLTAEQVAALRAV